MLFLKRTIAAAAAFLIAAAAVVATANGASAPMRLGGGAAAPGSVLSGAAVDCDWQHQIYFGANGCQLTITRASPSTSYAPDSLGNYIAFPANTPRITDLGLLIEEARSNGIRNNSCTGAVAGTSKAIGTVTGASRTASATAVFLTANTAGLAVGDLVTNTGYTGTNAAEYNGNFRVTAVTNNVSFSVLTTTSRSDSATPGSSSGFGAGTIPTNWVDNSNTPALGTAMVVLGCGTEQGVDYVEIRWAGLPASTNAIRLAFESTTQITAAYGQTWTQSHFMKLSGGSLTNVGQFLIQPQNRTGAGASINTAATNIPSPGGVLYRYYAHDTPDNQTTGAIQPEIGFNFTLNQPVDLTLRIGWPQLELNNQGIAGSVASATVNAGGTGYGNSVTGTMTYSGAGCSVNPVLNVTTNGSGVITTVNSVTTAGSCSTMPAQGVTTWTAGGGLSAGTNASFNLTAAQNVTKAYVSSPIRTTSAAVSRSAEDARLTFPPAWGLQFAGFLQHQSAIPAGGTTNPRFLTISDGTTQNKLHISSSTSTGFEGNTYIIANVAQFNDNVIASNVGFLTVRAAFTVAPSDQRFSGNGTSGTARTAASFIPTTVNIGADVGGSTVSLGFIQRMALWTRPLEQAFMNAITTPQVADQPPQIDCNFVTQSYFGAGACALSVTRASPSTSYAPDTSGTYQSFGANVARITNRGLWVEESRTNSALNNSAQGVAPGTPGTPPTNINFLSGSVDSLTRQIVGTGTENGIDYFDVRWFGTASATSSLSFDYSVFNNAAATYGQTWTGSAFLKLVSGTWNGISSVQLQILNRDGSGNPLSTAGTATLSLPTGAALGTQRQSVSATLTNSGGTTGNAGGRLAINYTSGQVIDFTVRIGWTQLEYNAQIASSLASATIQSGGSGYTNGAQVLTLGGGTCSTAPTINVTVAGNTVTSVNSVANAGVCTVFPPSPSTGTGGGGSNATFNLTPTDKSANGYASTPIRTTSAAVARSADDVRIAMPPINSNDLMFAMAARCVLLGTGQTNTCLTLTDNTSQNDAYLYKSNTEALRFELDVGGSVVSNIATGTWALNVSKKLLQTTATGDFVGYADGVSQGTASGAFTALPYQSVRIGTNQNVSTWWNGPIEHIQIWTQQRLYNNNAAAYSSMNYLLKRDLGGPANDNTPAFLGAAA